jgi:hyperosmotically inducible periplasmic protein
MKHRVTPYIGAAPGGVSSPPVMKIKNLSTVFMFLAGPLALLASPAEDRKIEQAAGASYNYRTVLEDRVTVRATNGVVTLTGTVQDKDEKALAEDTVENFPGVKRVKNEITIAPTLAEHSDAWIAVKIRSRLLVKGGVSAANTKVAVQDGVVTLSGSAGTLAQKELTGIYANEIEWVKSVKNHIVVKGEPVPDQTIGEKIDDASITSQVKYALLRHRSTSALKTKVVTNDGKIVITGEAGSDAEKSLVTKLAQDVRGVKSVSNGMTVKS